MFLDPPVDRIEWTERACCADRGVDVGEYFPTPGHAPSPAALAACRDCPVRSDCLAWAYERRISHGWFAGVAPTLRAQYPLGELLEFIGSENRGGR